MDVHTYTYACAYIVRIASHRWYTCAQLRNDRSDRMFRAFDAYLDESADHFGAEELAMRKVWGMK